MSISEIPPEWKMWCTKGSHAGRTKKNAVKNCLNNKNQVIGYYSDFPLKPDLDYTDSLYPSVEHLRGKNDNDNVVVETRIINDMKSHLSEKEFWQIISHLFFVGVSKGIIKDLPSGKRLKNEWKPVKNFSGNK